MSAKTQNPKLYGEMIGEFMGCFMACDMNKNGVLEMNEFKVFMDK